MPDGGMWDMTNPLGITTYKSCSGHKGHRECAEEYPAGYLPADEFHLNQGMCKACMAYRNAIMHSEAPRHPITNQLKWDWKKSYATKLGGKQNTPEWQSYLDGAEVRWRIEWKNHLLNTAPAQEVLAFMEPTKKETRKQPKFNQGKYKSPLARAVEKGKIKSNPEFSREGPGVVYVYEDEMKIPGVLKIGSTQYSKGRLPSANTWGAFNCLYERHFERRYEAEDIVHTMLDDCRIWRDKEWFKVSLERAIKTIEEVELDDTKEQALD